MRTYLTREVILIEYTAQTIRISRKSLRERAVELTIIDGRPAQDVSNSEWEQAKRELIGKPTLIP
jgi:hypothetical protein